nr:uncharacterized protein LOC110377904 [Helicoverpa armigera]
MLSNILKANAYLSRSIGDKNTERVEKLWPFENVDNNLSWDGVNYLNKDEIEAKYDIKLFTEKIEVVYKNVDGSVPKLWRKHDPHLTIHVGVRDVSEFLLEKQACKLGYQAEDTTGDCPGMHWYDGPHVLSTSLDVDLVCEEFNSTPPADGLQAKPSCDAGKMYPGLILPDEKTDVFEVRSLNVKSFVSEEDLKRCYKPRSVPNKECPKDGHLVHKFITAGSRP